MEGKRLAIKPILIGVLVVLILIIGLQNRQEVETKILFLTFEMPRIFLLLLTYVLGMVTGALIFMWLKQRFRNRKGADPTSAISE